MARAGSPPQRLIVQGAIVDLTHAEVVKFFPVQALRTQHASILSQLAGKAHSCVGDGSQGEVHAVILPLKHGTAPPGQRPGVLGAPAPSALVVVKCCIPTEEFPIESMAGELSVLRVAASVCPLIVHLYAAVGPDDNGLLLVLEAGMLSMETLIRGFTREVQVNGRMPVLHPHALQHMTACALSMLLVLRDAQVMHGDLKTEQLLLFGGNGTLKTVDLGCGKVWQEGDGYWSDPTHDGGSALYKCPEVLSTTELSHQHTDPDYGSARDAWALGLSLWMFAWAAATGKALDVERVLDMRDGKYSFSQEAARAGPGAQDLLSPAFVDLISCLLCRDPAVRLEGLIGAPDHGFFAGTVYGQLLSEGQDGSKDLANIPLPHMEELLGPEGPHKLYSAMAAVAETVQLPGVV